MYILIYFLYTILLSHPTFEDNTPPRHYILSNKEILYQEWVASLGVGGQFDLIDLQTL